MVLLGTNKQTLDSKNRTVVPAFARDSFKGEAVLFAKPNHCISMYPSDIFDTMITEMFDRCKNEADRKKIKNVTANSRRVNYDTAGRFTVPQEFIAHAQLGEEIMVVGCGKTLEVWSLENYKTSGFVSVGELTDDDIPEDLL